MTERMERNGIIIEVEHKYNAYWLTVIHDKDTVMLPIPKNIADLISTFLKGEKQ